MLNRLLDSQYEILAVLRPGTRATVHYGWDHAGQRPVAVAEIAAGAPDREQVLAGVQRSRRLRHQNLVTIYDSRQDSDGRVYVIMEFIDGMELGTALDRLRERGKRLPPLLAAYVTRQILQALDHIYTYGPPSDGDRPVLEAFSLSDVFLIAGGSVKLRGFGLGEPDAATYPQSAVMEAGSCKRYDLSVLGLLFSELLLGEQISLPDSSQGLGRNGQYRDDIFRRAGLPKRVEKIVRQALSDRPGVRYETARAMLDDLTGAQSALGADEPSLMLADLLDALEDDEEAAEHRRLLMMRGTTGSEAAPVVTEPLQDVPSSSEKPLAVNSATEERSAIDPYPWDGVLQREPEWTERERRRWPAWITVCVALLLVAYMVSDLYWGFGPLSQLTGIGPSGPQNGMPEKGAIVTVPPGAELTVNGQFAGLTPCTLEELPSGPVTLRLTLPGLIPIDTVLIIKDGENVGPFPPFVFQCRVHFNSVPEGARVMIDGHELTDIELARFTARVTDTLSVAMRVEGEAPLPTAMFNPLIGFVAPTDTTVWRWHPRSEDWPGQLTGVFRREIYIRSDPPGALVYVDGDSAVAGYTNLSLPLPYGNHVMTLHLDPYMDYRFAVHVGEETPSVFSAVLKRTVHIGAADWRYPATDIGATIDWIREGDEFVKTPFDDVKTPYSIQLGGLTHKIHLSHEGYWDTTVTLNAGVDQLDVAMRPMSEADRERLGDRDDRDNRGDAWVRFQVRDEDGPVADAEVIGVEKRTGVVVRYGTTGEAGQIITMVPPGDYDWRASKHGYEGRSNGERIKPGRGLKKITLRLAKR